MNSGNDLIGKFLVAVHLARLTANAHMRFVNTQRFWPLWVFLLKLILLRWVVKLLMEHHAVLGTRHVVGPRREFVLKKTILLHRNLKHKLFDLATKFFPYSPL